MGCVCLLDAKLKRREAESKRFASEVQSSQNTLKRRNEQVVVELRLPNGSADCPPNLQDLLTVVLGCQITTVSLKAVKEELVVGPALPLPVLLAQLDFWPKQEVIDEQGAQTAEKLQARLGAWAVHNTEKLHKSLSATNSLSATSHYPMLARHSLQASEVLQQVSAPNTPSSASSASTPPEPHSVLVNSASELVGYIDQPVFIHKTIVVDGRKATAQPVTAQTLSRTSPQECSGSKAPKSGQAYAFEIGGRYFDSRGAELVLPSSVDPQDLYTIVNCDGMHSSSQRSSVSQQAVADNASPCLSRSSSVSSPSQAFHHTSDSKRAAALAAAMRELGVSDLPPPASRAKGLPPMNKRTQDWPRLLSPEKTVEQRQEMQPPASSNGSRSTLLPPIPGASSGRTARSAPPRSSVESVDDYEAVLQGRLESELPGTSTSNTKRPQAERQTAAGPGRSTGHGTTGAVSQPTTDSPAQPKLTRSSSESVRSSVPHKNQGQPRLPGDRASASSATQAVATRNRLIGTDDRKQMNLNKVVGHTNVQPCASSHDTDATSVRKVTAAVPTREELKRMQANWDALC